MNIKDWIEDYQPERQESIIKLIELVLKEKKIRPETKLLAKYIECLEKPLTNPKSVLY